MPYLNQIDLIGHCGGDPEMRYTADGMPVTTFSLAVNDPKLVNGEWESNTQWFRVSVFKTQAERVNNQLCKGATVYVSGKLKLRKWTGNDDVERSSLEVSANKILIFTKGKTGNSQQPQETEEDYPF